jgi:hypothetical protein
MVGRSQCSCFGVDVRSECLRLRLSRHLRLGGEVGVSTRNGEILADSEARALGILDCFKHRLTFRIDFVGTVARDRRRASQTDSYLVHLHGVGARSQLRRFTASAFPWGAAGCRHVTGYLRERPLPLFGLCAPRGGGIDEMFGIPRTNLR